MPRLLLTHSPQVRDDYYGVEALAGLRALGDVILNESEEPLTGAALIRAAEGCDIIVSDRQAAGPAELFEALPDLAAFVRVAVDIRNVDVAAASRQGVLVTHASAGFMTSVAELVIGFMIDLARHVSRAAADYHAGRMPPVHMGRELRGGTIGILGYGAIGRRLGELAAALGMRVLASDPGVETMAPDVTRVDQERLLAEADFVVCLVVATEATENLMNAAAFAAMKRGAFFVNVSRGNLVDEAALRDALESGHLGGAAMDVGRAPDQMPSPALAALPNVIATPHIGGLTPEAVRHQALETARQCAEIVKGKAPVGAVNADRATRLARLGRA